MNLVSELEQNSIVMVPDAIPVRFAQDAYRAAETLFYCADDRLRRYQTTPDRPGYGPPGAERVAGGAPDALRRYWELRDPVRFTNQFPKGVPLFGPAYSQLFGALEDVGTRVLEGLSVDLGKPAGYFTERVRGGSHLLRVNHYPISAAASDRFPAHRDLGLLTLHVGGGAPGFEVEMPRGWIRPECPAGSLLVYGGNILSLEGAGRIRPLRHRVGGLTGERISIVFFLEPRTDILLPNGERAGDYLERIMRQIRVRPGH